MNDPSPSTTIGRFDQIFRLAGTAVIVVGIFLVLQPFLSALLYQPGDGWVLDPGGWLLEQFGMTVPPLYGPDSAVVVVFDPAGVLLELLGVDVAALPEASGPLDPAGSIFQQIGLTLPPDSPDDNPPDPAGTLLAFLFPGYDPASVSDEPLLDPGGILLAWIIPGYQPPPINDSQNPPPDPAGQLLAWLGSPELVNTSNNTLNPGDVILNWLFPPASEPQLPGEQDVVNAAMTSIVDTQPNLASLATNTPTPTLTLMPVRTLQRATPRRSAGTSHTSTGSPGRSPGLASMPRRRCSRRRSSRRHRKRCSRSRACSRGRTG